MASDASLQPEMETFPIIRPDLVPLLSKEWLARSQTELVPLIASLREEVCVQLFEHCSFIEL